MNDYIERIERLLQLNREYSLTDKGSHGYLESYAEYLPERCASLLEIGVAKGASLLMWNGFYKNECDISVLDLFEDPNHVTPRWCRVRSFTPFICDQSDINTISKILHTQFQVVIDDGSHRADHMIITWKHIFTNNLASKGLYVIEDLETCKEEFYRGGLCINFEDTALWMFKNYNKTGKLVNPYISEGEENHFQSIIEKVEVVEDKIVFIWKK